MRKLRGLKFQMAIQLVAEGVLREREVAARLERTLGTLTRLSAGAAIR